MEASTGYFSSNSPVLSRSFDGRSALYAEKVVDDDPVGCYDIFSQMKEWPQKIEKWPEEDLNFIPIYHIY